MKTTVNRSCINNKDKINSFIKKLTLFQLIKMHTGISKLVSTINGNETSSNPKCNGPQDILEFSVNQ